MIWFVSKVVAAFNGWALILFRSIQVTVLRCGDVVARPANARDSVFSNCFIY